MAIEPFEREAEIFQALCHPIRLKLIESLSQGARCTCEIEPKFDLSQPTISRHLVTLKRAGILSAFKDGTKVIYRIRDERVLDLIRTAAELARSAALSALESMESGTQIGD